VIHKQTRYESDISYELDRHGGVQAKNWRRRVANSAKRPPASLIKTLSFPLELSLDKSTFPSSNNLYNTVEGFDLGSLNHLLLCAHLSGLSLFQNAAQAASARQKAQFPNEQFVKAMEDGLGIVLPDFTPQTLLNLFQSAPRKSPPFTAEEVANRIHSSVFSKRISEKSDDHICEVFRLIAQAALGVAKDYSELKENSLQALQACGEALRKESPLFPSLAVTLAANTRDISLAFEGVVDSVGDDESQTYWLHHIIACLLRRDPTASAAQIQDSLLSFSNNALSQLFGSLLFSSKGKDGYLRSVEPVQFISDLGIQASRSSDAERFLSAAKAISHPQFFNEGGYSSYRPAVAGKLRSWVSNYISRLGTLNTQINALQGAELPPTQPEQLIQILDGLGLSMEDMLLMLAERQRAVEGAANTLQVLLGRDASARPISCAQTLEAELKSISDIHGTFRSVLNQINQKLEDAPDPTLMDWKASLAISESDVFVLPMISGGTSDVEEGLDEINEKLAFLFTNAESFADFIKVNSTGKINTYLESIRNQELQRAASVASRKLSEDEAMVLAKRRLMHGIHRLSKRLSQVRQAFVLEWLKPVIVNSGAKDGSKIFNRLKFNDQGRLYKSPWSPGRHQPLPACLQTFDAAPWRQRLQELQSTLRKELTTSPNPSALQDYLEVLRFNSDIDIQTLNGPIRVADFAGSVDLSKFDLHFKLKVAFAKPSVEAADLSSLLAWLSAQLSKMRFFARREQFVVRHKFSRVGQDDLILVPKNKVWEMPRKYVAAKGGIGPLLRKHPIIEEGATINAVQLFSKVASIPLSSGSSHLLEQIPHDWYLPLDLKGEIGTDISGLPVGKESVRQQHKIRRIVACKGARLIGPSSYLMQISHMLTGKTEAKEWMLILDWTYRSSLAFVEGAPKILAEQDGCLSRVAIPIEHKTIPNESVELFENVVAIDLGERQVGYAVFSVRDALTATRINPLVDPRTKLPANGAIRISGVNNLINAVRVHRDGQASNSKLKQNYDRGLEMMRDSVGSEIVQRIEALCARFNGFPLLESSVVNFQTGSRQLDLVYGDVVRHFAYSGVDAHKSARKEHWMGAEQWVHPYLMAKSFDEVTLKRTGKAKPLNLFPGTSVHPAGTSQVCTVCQRNSREALRQTGEKFTVSDNGVVQTNLGDIRLLVGMSYSEADFNRARRDKKNLPFNAPLKAGTYSLREMLGFEGRSRRQKNPSVMARDTTQSRFQCLFNDCRATYHADAGASINIGRKFFSTVIDLEESRRVMLDLSDLQNYQTINSKE